MNVINPGSTLMLKVNLNNILIDTVDSIQFYLSRTKDNNPTVTKTYKKMVRIKYNLTTDIFMYHLLKRTP